MSEEREWREVTIEELANVTWGPLTEEQQRELVARLEADLRSDAAYYLVDRHIRERLEP